MAERGGFEQKLSLESIEITGKEDTPLMLFSKLFSITWELRISTTKEASSLFVLETSLC